MAHGSMYSNKMTFLHWMKIWMLVLETAYRPSTMKIMETLHVDVVIEHKKCKYLIVLCQNE